MDKCETCPLKQENKDLRDSERYWFNKCNAAERELQQIKSALKGLSV